MGYKIDNGSEESAKKKEYWETAEGLQKVDGLEVSSYLRELAQKEIDGDLSYDELEEALYHKYEKPTEEELKARLKESDIVCARISHILSSSGSVNLNPDAFKQLHKTLFTGIYDHAGQFRTYNIRKDEPILNGDTVMYSDWRMIIPTLQYDMAEEKNKLYKGLDKQQILQRLAKFTCDIWQVHPFYEGNTRTTATLLEKYLTQMGFNINNDVFKDNSKYFRNALVLANYSNYSKNVYPDFDPLEKALDNFLFNGKHELRNRDLFVLPLFPEIEQAKIKYWQTKPKEIASGDDTGLK